jgi:hypothetical protein
MVALAESDRTLYLVRDPATREAAESLRQTAWKIIADSYHPGTNQWAGPHSRSYSDYLSAGTAATLSSLADARIVPHDGGNKGASRHVEPSWRLPCPAEVKERFRRLPSDPCELRRPFSRGATPADSCIGTTWLTADACLGSVNRGTFWTQCRPLVGYWKTDVDPAVVLRLRFLHDGKDFASMGVCTAQSGGRVLAVAYPLSGHGDWHPMLDRPAKGTFHAGDFRLRIELVGKGVEVEPSGEGRWALSAGNHRATVHSLPGRFAGQAVTWQSGSAGDAVYVDAVCYHGESRAFDFRQLPEVVLGVGIELLPSTQSPSAAAPRLKEQGVGAVEAVWDVGGGLHVASPVSAKVKKAEGAKR